MTREIVVEALNTGQGVSEIAKCLLQEETSLSYREIEISMKMINQLPNIKQWLYRNILRKYAIVVISKNNNLVLYY